MKHDAQQGPALYTLPNVIGALVARYSADEWYIFPAVSQGFRQARPWGSAAALSHHIETASNGLELIYPARLSETLSMRQWLGVTDDPPLIGASAIMEGVSDEA